MIPKILFDFCFEDNLVYPWQFWINQMIQINPIIQNNTSFWRLKKLINQEISYVRIELLELKAIKCNPYELIVIVVRMSMLELGKNTKFFFQPDNFPGIHSILPLQLGVVYYLSGTKVNIHRYQYLVSEEQSTYSILNLINLK